MASASTDPGPAFSYVVIYVRDVAKSVAFYAKAFSYNVRCLDEYNRFLLRHRCGELESGRTTIAFTQLQQHETDGLTGVVQTSKSTFTGSPLTFALLIQMLVLPSRERWKMVPAVPVSPPEDKNWGQMVGYVREIDGNIVRMESYISRPTV